MIDTARLHLVCSTDAGRVSIERVFVNTSPGGTHYAVAADGCVALLIEVADGFEPPERDDGDPEPPNVFAVIDDKPHGRCIDLAELHCWADEWRDNTCVSCDGRGHCRCECQGLHPCTRCDGRGRARSVEYGRIGPCVIDKNKLALVLRGLPYDTFGPVRVEWGDKHAAVHVVGDGWLGVVMPARMAADIDDAGIDPLFEEETT